MQAIDWYLECWTKKYARFAGRARRKEFWMFGLFNALVAVVLAGVAQAVPALQILPMAYSVAVSIPQLCVSIRRLHDIGKSGWWAALPYGAMSLWFALPCSATALAALAVNIVMLAWYVRPGDAGPNAWGDDPKAEA